MFIFCYNFFIVIGDYMDYRQYLFEGIHNPSIFKNIDIKRNIICNPSRHEITWFCQDNSVSSEMIYNLLDNEGLSILRGSNHYLNKINGIISCGKDISKLFDSKMFLEMLVELNDYYFYLKEIEAYKFINYCISNNLDVKRVFNMLNEESQVYVINNCDLSEYYYDLLISSKTECSKIIIDRISTLDNYNYYELLDLFSKDMSIPERLLNRSLVNKICSMYNVRNYRNLINNLSKNNDVSEIENLRRKFYDYFLEKCLLIYHDMLKVIKSGKNPRDVFDDFLNPFGGYDSILSKVYDDNAVEKKITKSMNYVTTDMVIDYVFRDYTSNVFLDINELIRFNNSTSVLSTFDKRMYSRIVSLDKMSISEKRDLLNDLKNLDMENKFYDDFRIARKEMVQMFNGSILNKESSNKYINKDLSIEYGVPIYEMNGNKFFVLVKSLSARKDEVLSERDLHVNRDGGSFSIDGSNKLNTFSDTDLYYNLAFDKIPFEQLVHVFEVDSYSNYYRDKTDIPSSNNGTDRINRLYTPDEFVGVSSSYNELVVSQPNETRNDEFNSKLGKPLPFAIYCYDEICENDIISAKKFGLGIILVRTNKYDIDTSNRVSLHSIDDRDICYVKPNENDYSRR